MHSSAAGDEPGSERERKELEERFDLLRPEVLEELRKPSHDHPIPVFLSVLL